MQWPGRARQFEPTCCVRCDDSRVRASLCKDPSGMARLALAGRRWHAAYFAGNSERIDHGLRIFEISLVGGKSARTAGQRYTYCEIFESTTICPRTCRDSKDQPSLDLAHSGKAESLVTGDGDLLALAGQTGFLIEASEPYRLRINDSR